MARFKDKLLAAVGPELEALGYEYDESLREQRWLFGFRKQLRDDVYALITFQRTQHNRFGFYVNLHRHNTSGRDEYKGFITRLGWVVCVVYYGWRHCPLDQDLWNATDEKDLDAVLADALEKLKAYGIPFLEDPASKLPTPIRDWEILQFRDSVAKIVLPGLQKLGFKVMDSRPGEEHLVCFSKQIFGGFKAFVAFFLCLGEGEEELGFRVEILRHHGSRPISWSEEKGFLQANLEHLLERKYGFRVGPSGRPHIWRYRDAQGLDLQLEDVVARITEYAIPWLEDPLATMVDLFPALGQWR